MAELHRAGFTQAWPESDMRQHVEKDVVLGIGEPLHGFLIMRQAVDQAELLTIVIAEDHRRKGAAGSLLSAGEKAIRELGADILFLEVAEDNPGAIAFYRKQGYTEFARRPAYYKRPNGRVAALLFRKQV